MDGVIMLHSTAHRCNLETENEANSEDCCEKGTNLQPNALTIPHRRPSQPRTTDRRCSAQPRLRCRTTPPLPVSVHGQVVVPENQAPSFRHCSSPLAVAQFKHGVLIIQNNWKLMDLNLIKPFKLDIDELISEFTKSESTTLGEFRRVWLSRKFSFIFEASPSTNQGFFMQSLYAHSIGYMNSAGCLSNRLGGMYCLYCLYETQPFKPPFKIYLSLEELKELKKLVVYAKENDVKVVSALLKRMLENNMFLFGFVGANEGFATKRVNELTDLQNAVFQGVYQKLFANSRLEHFIHMDLGTELDVDLLKKKSSDYAVAKELAIKEASQVIDVQDIKHISENKKLIGDVVEESAADWNCQKELFYHQTGLSRLPLAVNQEENEYVKRQSSNENMQQKEHCDNLETEQENHDDFGNELEAALLFDNEEEDEPIDASEDDI